MVELRRSLGIALSALALVPSVAAADTSFPAAAGHLTAHDDMLVWSPYTGPGQLMSGFGDAAAPLLIPRARFASIDLGTAADGRTVLAYTSCQAARPRHCAAGLYDFASGRHRRLAALNRGGCRVHDVRISQGTIAFTRDCGGLYVKRPGRPVRRVRGVGSVRSFDIAGNTLAFVALRRHKGPEEGTWWVTTQVRALQLGQRRSRLLAREHELVAPSSHGTYAHDVSLDSGLAYWERDVSTGNFRQEIRRRPIDASAPATELDRTGRLYADPTADRLGTYAVSGDRLYYTRPAIVTGTTALIAQTVAIFGPPPPRE
jgi:hypothetical protein